ncbi:hypothetical protein ABZY31_09375 [Streptomyces sp. NPDC006529]|uniref:hypothetical protein n=1 Tax=Streptomyces sp. NPDC006529 TaxID=3157177 RepID=UPI0033AA38E1
MGDDTTEAMRRAREARLKYNNAAPPTRTPKSPPAPARPAPTPTPTPTPASTPTRQVPVPTPGRASERAAVRARTVSQARPVAGLGEAAAFGQGAALTLFLWQLLLMTDWTYPLRLSAELAPRWSFPHDVAVKELRAEWFPQLRDLVLFQGPGREYPWLFPVCAVVLYLLVRVGRLPEALQAVLGTLISLYGLAALLASGPSLLHQWPLALALAALSAWALNSLYVRE